MCGIAGFIDQGGVSRERLQGMSRALIHRGPDGEGLHHNDHAGFVHRRLSIIDLEGGAQPMCSADGRYWLTFNGEIYNYQDLRAELANEYRFVTSSDSEVLLALYIRDGVRCLDRLRGMFAFAVYDTVERRLFMARDHFGQKPLFYMPLPEGIAFASEIKALLTLSRERPQMDPRALYEYLTVRVVTPPLTMFAGICKLPPAHYLIHERGRTRVERYWQLDYRNKLTGSLGDLTDQLDRQISESVRYHLVSDVGVGAFLSGGMDSSLIVSMMSRHMDQFPTFTGQVGYEEFGEARYAEIVASHFGKPNFAESFVPSLTASLPLAIYHMDEPSDALSVALHYISGVARRHVKVVLGGEGGDELFAGYDRYYGIGYARLLALFPAWFRDRVIERLIDLMPAERWYTSATHQARWLNYVAGFRGAERYSKSLSYFYFSDRFKGSLYTPEFLSSAGAHDPEATIKRAFEDARADEVLDRMLHSDTCIRMPDHPVMILDRMTMAHGLEARAPLLDHKLAEFCARIPSRYKIRARSTRVIQRELCRRHLPRAILARKKQGFSSPIPYLLDDQYRRIFQTYLSESRLADEGYLNPDFMSDLLEAHLNGKADHGQRLWLLASAELWHRMFVDGLAVEQITAELEGSDPVPAGRAQPG